MSQNTVDTMMTTRASNDHGSVQSKSSPDGESSAATPVAPQSLSRRHVIEVGLFCGLMALPIILQVILLWQGSFEKSRAHLLELAGSASWKDWAMLALGPAIIVWLLPSLFKKHHDSPDIFKKHLRWFLIGFSIPVLPIAGFALRSVILYR